MNFRRTSPEGESSSAPAPKPSALGVARSRALHQLLDTPLVFEDPLAIKILGANEEEFLLSDREKFHTPLFKGVRASAVVRSRLAEDEWIRAWQRGVCQYVILGAGLDTFAYRTPNREGFRVFEVDLPATLRWKRERLREAGLEEPSMVIYAPCDFERCTLTEALEEAGFCKDQPAFFSWLGVAMYLGEEAIRSTLRFVASLKPGSGIVFDFAVSPTQLSPRERLALEVLTARTTEDGEPWKAYFDLKALQELLHSLGFAEVELYASQRLNELYFSGRTDGLRKSGLSALISARV